jgi:hypothetical protein
VEATYDPFAILNVEPGVSLEAARASYRKLARQHHPDVVPEHERERATKMMAVLNEAMADLERDFEGWTRRFTAAVLQTDAPSAGVLSVEPRFVILSEANGFEAFVTVATPSGDGRQIGMRYREGLIVAERLRVGSRGVANFRLRVSPRLRVLGQPERVEVELVAPGHAAVNVTVAVEPFRGCAEGGVATGGERLQGWLRRLRNRL